MQILPQRRRRGTAGPARARRGEARIRVLSAESAAVPVERRVACRWLSTIEIASASARKRDETLKRRLYERFGVSEYWVVDPEVERTRVYRRAGDVFARAQELTREMHDELTTPLLPGLVVPLDVIFKK